ncbi:protein Star isoform X1 [Anopheles stephensi]|uniref:protein Star isoform X1 n=2 Tax=Anopheles stephensi TaxID=30069 RepID=UPI0016588B80|nr:protein Star isoform X1 [Anopheles stephensi]XP_035915762.1 protein Star isoform X1 [Anopheles stephensi]XP_035915763.1 protein Star isoform X1 [Anopheles stephensi]XP_035915764.1 protein Star isoform X1 [Anopheles stephensi]XP_035915766.1 protein Star isoform X1 [Anopheles stephensi]XP_035915767.1 protein Star isoform X1 [Anopheles stephensi]XP_035915768.1 protein Star isoform X1 [Anopheles stephensi]
MTIFSSYGMRTKVQEKKGKMSSDEQQQQQQNQQQQQQQQQNQIPNIAGTILIGGIGGLDGGQHKQAQSQHNQHLPHQQHHLHSYTHILPHLHQFSTMTGSNPASLTGASSKLPSKSSPLGPSPFRQLLPVTLCIISFATVLSILIIYMDTTEIRHQQFRLNMSRDYDLMGVPQDNPALVKYVRDIHMKKYPMTFMRNANAPAEHLNFTDRHELTPEMAHLISDLLGRKRFGTFFQSLTGNSDSMMTAPWLAETMNWGGYLVEPDPRKYFSLRKQNAFRSNVQVIHACLSPNTYPKEVTLHHDDDSEVQINSVLDEETEWFHPRVKCFPVYTLMLAVNRTSIDLLSLGCHGQELQILQTIPFDRVHIKVISIHLVHYYEEDEMMIDVDEYVQTIGRFLMSKSYKLVRSMDRNFIYQHLSVLSAAKQRQRQQQQQQPSLPMADGALPLLQQQPAAIPARGNAISSGEKPDATMAIRKGQDVSGSNGGNGGKPSVTPPSTSTTTVTTTTAAAMPASSTDGVKLAFSSERFDKLMLLRGGDSEPFDGVSSADSSAQEESSIIDEEVIEQQDDQQRDKELMDDGELEQPAMMAQPLEEIEDGSVRVAGSPPPPMVTSLK